jgi:hypothetical protein
LKSKAKILEGWLVLPGKHYERDEIGYKREKKEIKNNGSLLNDWDLNNCLRLIQKQC